MKRQIVEVYPERIKFSAYRYLFISLEDQTNKVIVCE